MRGGQATKLGAFDVSIGADSGVGKLSSYAYIWALIAQAISQLYLSKDWVRRYVSRRILHHSGNVPRLGFAL